jgi:hypothetical protein
MECVFCNRNGQKVRDRSASKGLLIPGLSRMSGGEHLMAIPKNPPILSQSTATLSGSYRPCPKRKYETSGVGYVQKKKFSKSLDGFCGVAVCWLAQSRVPAAFPLRHGKFQLSHLRIYLQPRQQFIHSDIVG